jgi:hypothetical protein
METVAAGFKRCSKCKMIKPLSEFHNNRFRKDGKVYYCKVCASEIRKKKWESMGEKDKNRIRRRKRERYKELTKEQKADRSKRRIEQQNKNLQEWEIAIRKIYDIKGEFKCEVCGKKLNFPKYGNGYNKDNVICFDHKNNNVAIKHPTKWLAGHFPTPKSIKIFKSCNFGIVCHWCNVSLGSPQNRLERLKQQLRYVQDNSSTTAAGKNDKKYVKFPLDNFILMN